MLDVASVFGLVFAGMFGVGPQTDNLVRPEYQCQKPVWVKAPAIKSGHFEGTVSISCKLKGEHGGGFPHLREAMENYLVEGAETVHSGPVDIEYKGMPGVMYDVTMLFSAEEGKQVRIRGANHIASNLENNLKYDFFSKDIKAEGMAKYMKVVNILADVASGSQEGWYDATVSGEMKVEKPGLIPGSLFINQVKAEVEAQIEEKKEEVVTEIANNL